jgi:hypothetical protein
MREWASMAWRETCACSCSPGQTYRMTWQAISARPYPYASTSEHIFSAMKMPWTPLDRKR